MHASLPWMLRPREQRFGSTLRDLFENALHHESRGLELLSPPLYPLTTRSALGIDKRDFSTAMTISEKLRLR